MVPKRSGLLPLYYLAAINESNYTHHGKLNGMKKNSVLLKWLCFLVCGTGIVLFSCKKNSGTDPLRPDPPGDTKNSFLADTIANRLILMHATKLTGKLPNGPSGSSLKISIKDTLYLSGEIKIPIKFLQQDTTKNITGALIQISAGGSASSYYFDVPEVADVADNDTVAMILVAIDTKDMLEDGVPPVGGVPLEIKIVPHDKNGDALAEVTRPISISKPKKNITGPCGLVNNHGDAWIWEYSYTIGQGDFDFFNSPLKLWGLLGQEIQGCCTNGESDYTANCAPENKRRLNFQTFFNWPREKWVFLEGGIYGGVSDYLAAFPEPEKSDFCGDGPGVVQENFRTSFPDGKWSVNGSMLSMAGTVAANTAARPNGEIFILNCRFLTIIQRSAEGDRSALAKFYYRQNPGESPWHNL